MVLYTCAAKKIGGSLGHPCGHAAIALDKAGISYEIKTVGGFKNVPFTTGGGRREEVKALSGQERVPILVLDDDTVITGSKEIATWAKTHARA